MPEFKMDKIIEIKRIARIGARSIYVRFRNIDDLNALKDQCLYYNAKEFFFLSLDDFTKASKQKITEKTKSIWFPYKPHRSGVKMRYISTSNISNRYPVYVVSKNRWNNGLTTKALHSMGVPHFIVVEKSQFDAYQRCANASAIIIELPQSYIDEYETCDNLGDAKSKGPGAARNFCIDHSFNKGAKRHWVMDDNLDAFHYLNRNMKAEVECAATIAAAEDFIDRFLNIPVAGLNYYSFAKAKDALPPYVLNTRIYSCLLIENASGYRWRGRYNEDTDLSLRVLKDGFCTLQFNAFLCGKVTTQRMKGGNTDDFYSQEGTLPKSQMLADLHPDVASVVWRFNRWHHHVDYSKFKKNKLKIGLPHSESKNYGLTLVTSKQEPYPKKETP
jgi:hypothetical protein